MLACHEKTACSAPEHRSREPWWPLRPQPWSMRVARRWRMMGETDEQEHCLRRRPGRGAGRHHNMVAHLTHSAETGGAECSLRQTRSAEQITRNILSCIIDDSTKHKQLHIGLRPYSASPSTTCTQPDSKYGWQSSILNRSWILDVSPQSPILYRSLVAELSCV